MISEKNEIINIAKDTVCDFIKNKGITADSIMDSLKNICETLEVNDKLEHIIENKTGNDKATLAVDTLVDILNIYKMNSDGLSVQEDQVLNFFTSSLGRGTLMAGTNLLLYTIPHISKSWNEADLNNDGCVYGKRECETFFKYLFLCK